MWIYTAFPPSGNADSGRTLAVVDFKCNTVTPFPETNFRDASPLIDLKEGYAYWCSGYSVFRRSPSPTETVELVNEIPEAIHRNRLGKRLATHLTMSSDRKELFIDAHFGREWVAGSLPLNGKAFQPWETFDRCFNHAQFSPTNPDLALIAQDWWTDIVTGKLTGFDNRIWLIHREKGAKPIFKTPSRIAHEWWDPDGEHIWYVDYEKGTHKVSIISNKNTRIWPGETCHSHSSSDGKFLVADKGPYSWAETGCKVSFFNTSTSREVDIATDLPLPSIKRHHYHIDPHPQFCYHDSVICYTTTVNNVITVALALVDDLIDATS